MTEQKNKDKGYIKIYRKIMENPIWQGGEFAKGQAWIDLLLNAQFQNGFFYSKKGKIDYNRGDCTFSLSDLSKRWGWSRCKVRNFLNTLEEHEMIKRKMIKSKYSIITILNYDEYQGKERVVSDKTNNDSSNNKTKEEEDYDKSLRFLLGDEYEDFMAEKRAKERKKQGQVNG